jgi:hypothetical protein
MFSIRSLTEQGVDLIDEDDSWLMKTSHREESTHHLFAFTNLKRNQ